MINNNRLSKTRDFNLLLKYGRYINGNFLDLKLLKLISVQEHFPKQEDINNFKKQLKLAFSVGLKVSKSAVKRNRARRQIKEAVRLVGKKQPLPKGYYLLFVAKPSILTKNYAEISQAVELLLNKSGIVSKTPALSS